MSWSTDLMTRKKSAGVNFDPGVLEYIDDMANRQDLSRSYVINRIIRDHAQQNGDEITTLPRFQNTGAKTQALT